MVSSHSQVAFLIPSVSWLQQRQDLAWDSFLGDIEPKETNPHPSYPELSLHSCRSKTILGSSSYPGKKSLHINPGGGRVLGVQPIVILAKVKGGRPARGAETSGPASPILLQETLPELLCSRSCLNLKPLR